MIVDFIKTIRSKFHPTLMDKVLAEVKRSQEQSSHCILTVTPTDVIRQTITLPANVALIHHEKIKDFQRELLAIELKLIALNHYCIIKLAEDKSYANLFVFIENAYLDEPTTTKGEQL